MRGGGRGGRELRESAWKREGGNEGNEVGGREGWEWGMEGRG